MRLRALLTCAALLFSTAHAQEPELNDPPPVENKISNYGSRDFAESSAVIWLGITETHFPHSPEDREFLRNWQRAAHPGLYPPQDSVVAPADSTVRVPVEVRGYTGRTIGGVPFPKGVARPEWGWNVVSGGLRKVAETAVLAKYDDGSVMWLRVVWDNPSAAPDTLESAAPSQRHDYVPDAWTTLPAWAVLGGNTSGVVAAMQAVEGHYFIRVTNTTPTGVSSNQPTCMGYGTPEDRAITLKITRADVVPRWGVEQGIAPPSGGESVLLGPGIPGSTLRAGDQKTFELVPVGKEQPTLLCTPEWYVRVSLDGALPGGPMAPFNLDVLEFAAYEAHVLITLDAVFGNTPPPHWRNPRDAFCLQRDFDGGVIEVDFQTHGNEYNLFESFGRQGMRLPRDGADPRIPVETAYKGVTLMVRGAYHDADFHVHHVHSGPLPWMFGWWWQHPRHGGNGQGTQHRSSFPPNMAHCNPRHLLLTYYMTGAPHLLDSWNEVAAAVGKHVGDWKTGVPGYANLSGEERAGANAVEVLLDNYKFTRSQTAKDLVTKALLETVGRRGYNSGTNTKPWQVGRLGCAALECEDAGFTVPGLAELRAFLAGPCFREDPTWPHLVYQLNHPELGTIDEYRDMWNIYGGDVLVGTQHDAIAKKLYYTGSHSPWYPSAPAGRYTKLQNSGGLCASGQRYMAYRLKHGG